MRIYGEILHSFSYKKFGFTDSNSENRIILNLITKKLLKLMILIKIKKRKLKNITPIKKNTRTCVSFHFLQTFAKFQ